MVNRADMAYIRSIGGYIVLSAALFLASSLAGYQAASRDPAFAEQWMAEMEMLRWIMTLNPALIMIIIFLKNLLACLIAVLLGLGIGLVPLLVAMTNGILLGVVARNAAQTHGLLFLAAGILPHGIIELPTVLLSIAMGLRLGHLIIYSVLGVHAEIRLETMTALHILLRLVVPLLLIAAMIETFITPFAISLALSHL